MRRGPERGIDRRPARAAALTLILAAPLVLSASSAETIEHRQKHEAADIAKLAALTRTDRSTLFFAGSAASGYVRDGVVHYLALPVVKEPMDLRCRGKAVSRDGTRIAYVVTAADAKRCELVVRNIGTGAERVLTSIEQSFRPLAWSWDDSEIAYERLAGVVSVSTSTGRERLLARRPLLLDGQPVPGGGYSLNSVDWLHHRHELVVDVDFCVPTPKGDSCQEQAHTVLAAEHDSHLLAVGRGASVSPTGDVIAYATSDHVEIVGADGAHRRRVATIPGLFRLPILREWVSGKMKWSPLGDRLIFGTVIDEEWNGNYYLVDLARGKRQPLLTNTSIDIVAWR